MNTRQKNHYKETDPVQTVARLKTILEEMQIKLEENWLPKSLINTYSLRLTVKGTNIGTNGKGVAKEYALASAYAEFFERFQNNVICFNWETRDGFRYFPDEKKMTSFEVAQTDNAFINMYFANRGLENESPHNKALKFRNLERIDYQLHGEDDLYTVLPFYSVRKGITEYLPYNVCYFYYCTNGMCAGNTREEALVQGLSEILERYVQKKLFTEKLSLPDIPEEYIKKFPYIDLIFQKLKQQDGYTFMLKDCSLGGQFPVAALISIHKDTGGYGVKLGCHPDFGIAMERAITETTQGVDITSAAADRGFLDFRNRHVQDDVNIFNSYKFGIAQYPYEILLDPPTYPFVPVKDVSCLSNKELLNAMTEQILSMGYDVLIRDVSHLGFPSYHIIIPGMSELQDVTDLKTRAYTTGCYAAKLLNNPSSIDRDNCRYIIGAMRYFAPSQIENTMNSHYSLPIRFHCPGEEIGAGWVYMTAMCYAFMGEYVIAANYMKGLADAARNSHSGHGVFYTAVYYYLDGMAAMGNHKRVIQYLKPMFSKELYEKVDSIFEDPDQIITKQYPNHKKKMDGYCHNRDCCDYDAYLDSLGKLRERQSEHPIIQDDLSSAFKDVINRVTHLGALA